MNAPRAYEADGQPVDAAQFTRIACDPARSVVVEACAGSGKTWLLVARMLRLLLAGAEPSELLAITFTRKAAQEMRERLLHLLHELALAPDEQVIALLRERGLPDAELGRVMPLARSLYERVLASPHSLSIDTFHSWFARLVQIAPLTSGVPHGYSLSEATGELVQEAYGRFMQALNDAEHEEARQSLLRMFELVGDSTAHRLLDAFLDKRAEWMASLLAGEDAPLQWLRELCGPDGEMDARLSLWDDEALRGRLLNLARVLGQGAKKNQDRAVAIESAITAGASLENFAALLTQFFDDKGKARGNDHRRGKMLAAAEQHYGVNGADRFEEEFLDAGAALLDLQRRSFERLVLELNDALFRVGTLYLEHYQSVKAEQRVFDFSDLEWHAYRLLSDGEHAAYLQSRLDARYKHILLDEFQDTNPLQWSIVRAWLAAYGDDAQQPSVFVVGDPKQSIYRFRRAEPRVFAAARDLLAAQGAAVLRTNQTRRNARHIIAVLNDSLRTNPIFSPQTTLAASDGEVWRLALVTQGEDDPEVQAEAAAFTLRDPLTEARAEQEDARRVLEGQAVAQAILQARAERNAAWSDVMLLVKKRKHLAAYESALRAAGIPFISDKRGGLLESLEVADLIALLGFLITPGDNRALAHVLKSPVFGVDDADLIALAQRREPTWWARLQAGAADASPAVQRAHGLLQRWLSAAPRLPVHDLLDLILHEGDLVARYASAAQPAMRAQVLGNIEAFTELALNLDAGRYPSLPKFIDALGTLRKHAESDAPDEAAVDATVDAVRILTIHSAKGLEAGIVVLVDANHSDPARDDCGILCDWPQDSDAPTHFSCFAKKDERGAARDHLFAAEEAFRMQEDWNLLYVAATRAKELLIVSGVAGSRGALPDGCIDGSWYHRLAHVEERIVGAQSAAQAARLAAGTAFELPIYSPAALAADDGSAKDTVHSEAIDEGIALHTLLERLTQFNAWPCRVPNAERIARWLDCPATLAETIAARASRMLSTAELERFFNPQHFRFARNELEVVDGDTVVRFDRAVVFDDEVWILDYKRDLLDSERTGYGLQLQRYRDAAGQVFPGLRVRTAIITPDGTLSEFD